MNSFKENPKEELERQKQVCEANLVAQKAREIRYQKKMEEKYAKLDNDDV